MDTYICITDSLCCTPEANTILQINYIPIIIFLQNPSWTCLWLLLSSLVGGVHLEFVLIVSYTTPLAGPLCSISVRHGDPGVHTVQRERNSSPSPTTSWLTSQLKIRRSLLYTPWERRAMRHGWISDSFMIVLSLTLYYSCSLGEVLNLTGSCLISLCGKCV